MSENTIKKVQIHYESEIRHYTKDYTVDLKINKTNTHWEVLVEIWDNPNCHALLDFKKMTVGATYEEASDNYFSNRTFSIINGRGRAWMRRKPKFVLIARNDSMYILDI